MTFCLTACAAQPEIRLQPGDAERAVANWLNCDECYNRQFEHVVALGDAVVPVLKSYLDDEDGRCAGSDRAGVLAETYERADRAVGDLGETKAQFVARHIRAHCDRVQQRARVALRAIAPSELPRDRLRSGLFDVPVTR